MDSQRARGRWHWNDVVPEWSQVSSIREEQEKKEEDPVFLFVIRRLSTFCFFIHSWTKLNESRHSMPHMDLLASAARDADVQLAIVVLLRDASAVEQSIEHRFHRQFHKSWSDIDRKNPIAAAMAEQSRALRQQSETLSSPLSRPSTQLVCVEFEKLPAIASSLDDLLSAEQANEWSFGKAVEESYVAPSHDATAGEKECKRGCAEKKSQLSPVQLRFQNQSLGLEYTCKICSASWAVEGFCCMRPC